MRAGTARGFRDILPSEALARERIVGMVQACLTGHGYVPVETPLLELHETFERVGKPRIPSFQLFDSEHLMGLTTPLHSSGLRKRNNSKAVHSS